MKVPTSNNYRYAVFSRNSCGIWRVCHKVDSFLG